MTRTARIAFVTDTLGTHAGSESSLVTHAELAARGGLKVLVAADLRDEGLLPYWRERLLAAGADVVFGEGTKAEAIAQMTRAITAFRADIVHFLPMGRLAEAWVRDGLNREARRIATETSEASPRCIWYDPATFRSFARLDAIIAPCRAVGLGLRSHFGYRGPIEIVPHWISPATFVPRFHEAGEVTAPFRLVAVSRLRVEKGIDFMVAALALLARTHDVTLDIHGENGEEQRCHELCAAFGVADRVRILGPFLGDTQEREILDGAHVVLLSSLFEGLPLAVMKAIAVGRVAVATRVGGVPELLEPLDPGLVVPAGDPAAMASAVAALLDAPGRLFALERRARAHFTTHYDPASVERRHLAFYESLAERAVSCG